MFKVALKQMSRTHMYLFTNKSIMLLIKIYIILHVHIIVLTLDKENVIPVMEYYI